MKFYAVIDTNVLVSSMLKGSSIPGIIVDHAINGAIIPVVNNEMIEEYQKVLLRKKISFPKKEVISLLNELKKHAIFLDITNSNESFIDPDDIVFYEITLTAKEKYSSAYLITGNKKHFPAKTFVVTPREMLDIIGE